MGLLSAIGLNKKVQFILNGNTVIDFEASLNETHSRDSSPTEFPIEDGKTINDHVIIKPFSLEMTLMITDNPLSSLGALLTEAGTTLTSALTPPIGTIALGAGLGGLALFNTLKGGKSPSAKAFQQLLDLQNQANPFTVLTTLKRYENMVISSISVPREAANGKCIIVTVGLKQLTIVKPKIIQIRALANPGLSDSLRDLGQQSGSNGFIDGETDSTNMLKKAVNP